VKIWYFSASSSDFCLAWATLLEDAVIDETRLLLMLKLDDLREWADVGVRSRSVLEWIDPFLPFCALPKLSRLLVRPKVLFKGVLRDCRVLFIWPSFYMLPIF